MGINNGIVQTLLKTFSPSITKLLEGGKIDAIIQQAKKEYSERCNLYPGESMEVLISTEEDGREYVNLVVMDGSMYINKVVFQQPLADFVRNILNNANI